MGEKKPPRNPTLMPMDAEALMAEFESESRATESAVKPKPKPPPPPPVPPMVRGSTAQALGSTPLPMPKKGGPPVLPTLAPIPIGELVAEAMERGADKQFERREQWEAKAVEEFERSAENLPASPPSMLPFEVKKGPSLGQMAMFALLALPPLLLLVVVVFALFVSS